MRRRASSIRAAALGFQSEAPTPWQYRARIPLEGGSDLFKVGALDVQVSGEMKEQWCYLLRDDTPPLSLAPIVFCAHRERRAGTRSSSPGKIPSLEPGAKIDGVGVASAASMRVG